MRIQAGVFAHRVYLANRLDNRFDGDMMSDVFILSQEANKEIDDLLSKASYYLDPNGKIAFSADNDTISIILKSILS